MRNVSFTVEYKKPEWKLVKRLLAFMKPYKLAAISAFVLAILGSGIAPLTPYLSKIAIDEYIPDGDYNGVLKIAILITIVLVVRGILKYFQTYVMNRTGQKVLFDIRKALFDKIHTLLISWFDKHPVGSPVTRVTNDVEAMNKLFTSGIVLIIADIAYIVWIVAFMFYTDAGLALITLSVLPVLLAVSFFFRKKIREIYRLVRIKISEMNSFLNETFSGIHVVKQFNAENKSKDDFNFLNFSALSLNLKGVKYFSMFFPAIELISGFALGLALWYSAGSVISHSLSAGVVIAFMQYIEMFFRPVRDLSEKYTTLQAAMASSEKIFSFLDEDSIENNLGNNKNSFKQSIHFKNLAFSYDGKKQVLRDINFEVKKGETVAIVGATGSGKTTIVNLLLRFYDGFSGNIFIDGVDIREVNPIAFRKLTALVMQENIIFRGSLAENIIPGSKPDDKKLIEAAKSVGAYGFISKLPGRFAYDPGDFGANLSTGQKQLIAICRAFAADPEILILDEASSGIDSGTEHIIENSLHKLFSGRTSIVIAHRLSTVKKADRIIVLHHGEIRESGTHKELIEKNGIYAKLVILQMSK